MTKEFAGTLSQQIHILQLTNDRTEGGLSSSLWTKVLSCRACVIPEGSGAEAEGMTLSGMPRMRVVIRNSRLVAIEQRLDWRGRSFLIRQIVEDPRSPDRLELRCEEVRT